MERPLTMTDIETVRLLIQAVAGLFSDDEIQALLDLESGSVRMAAAAAYRAAAGNASKVAKVSASGVFSDDLRGIPVALAARADELQAREYGQPYTAETVPPDYPGPPAGNIQVATV